MLRVRWRVIAAVGLAFASWTGDGAAQRASGRDGGQSRALAERAQRQFESFRRRQLPVTGSRSTSTCDVRVGRFCYWHDDAGDPPREPAPIAAARESLVRVLDSLARRTPQDAFVVGQQVRYLAEAGRAEDAVRAADGCRAEAWWCAALRGFAAHTLGDFAMADTAFAAALAAMPDAQRCRWTDLGELLPDGYRRQYREIPCAARDSVNARVWWLADPRWAAPGNDFRSEVYARLTMGELVQQARSAHDLSWGDDMRQLMLRYGWPTAWSRDWPSTMDPTRISVIGHEPSPSYEFVPDESALRQPLAAMPDAWSPRAERPHTRYAPVYGRHYRPLDPQIAWFRRGDAAVLVVAYDARYERDSVFTGDRVETAAVLSRSPGDAAVARATTPNRRGALAIPATPDSALLSLEVSDSSERALARARLSVRPPERADMSDLLLFDGRDGLAETFERAVALALGAPIVAQREGVGVYWELYGAATSGDVSYSVSVERESPGWMRRMAERVGLADPVLPVRVSFDERRPGSEISARSLIVDVSHIPPGRYRMTVQAQSEGWAARASRAIEVR